MGIGARIAALAAGALLLVALLPAAAPAAVRLGPDISKPLPSGGFHLGAIGCQAEPFSPCYYLNLRSTNPDALAAAPADGVIVRWRFRAGCCTDPQTVTRTMKLATFSQGVNDGFGGYGYVVLDQTGAGFDLPPGNQVLADVPVQLPARLPIKAGQRVGIIADHPIGFSVHDETPGVTAASITHNSIYQGQAYGYTFGAAVQISADVEPDADRDGYGDETQDCQPADPTRQEAASCAPPPAPGPPAPLIVNVPCGSQCPSTGPGGGVVFPRPLGGQVPPSTDGIHFYIPLACPKAATQPCGGFLVIEPAGGKKASASAKRTTLGRVKYSVKPGTTAKVRFTLSRAGRALLARRRTLRVTVRVQPQGAAETTLTRTLKVKKRARGR